MSESHHHSSSPKGYLNQLETTLDLYFRKKAPALPKGGKDFIVMIAPWLVIIGVIFSIPSILLILGLSNLGISEYGDFSQAVTGRPTAIYYLSTILLLVAVVLEIMALPGLFAKKRRGWELIFYSTLVSLVSSLVAMSIAGSIIGALISFYLLFQIREYYK